jgi:tRNA-specific 2-thiouridylase
LGHLAKKQSTEPRSLGDASHHDHLLNNIANQLSVRDIALRAKIPTASKKESMGICFIGKRNFGQFVSQYLPDTPAPGSFVDVDTGEIVGHHRGSMKYTIGQGAKISGGSTKYFVCGKGGNGSNEDNTVFVCNDTHHPSLYTDELYVDFNAFNWIGVGESINDGNFGHVPYPLLEGQTIELLARTRHLQPLAPCSVTWQKHQSDNTSSSSLGRLVITFHRPMRAITPGQIVALYAGTDGLICLGGGPICSRGKSLMERGLEVSLSMLHPSGHNDLSLIRS